MKSSLILDWRGRWWMLKMTRGEGWRLLKDSVPIRGFQLPSTLMRNAHPYQHLPPLFGYELDCSLFFLNLINLEIMTCSFRRYPRHVVWNHERGHDHLHSPLLCLFCGRVVRHPQTLVAVFEAVHHILALVALFEAVLHPSLLRRLVAQLVVSRPQHA